jgi:CBS domain-containing protein
VDIPGFVRLHPPIDELSDDEIAEVVRATRIEFFPPGSREPAARRSGRELLVRRADRVGEVLDGDHIVDLHQEGEVLGYVSLLTGEEPALTVQAHEETICYLVEPEVAERIFATRHGVVHVTHRPSTRAQGARVGWTYDRR